MAEEVTDKEIADLERDLKKIECKGKAESKLTEKKIDFFTKRLSISMGRIEKMIKRIEKILTNMGKIQKKVRK